MRKLYTICLALALFTMVLYAKNYPMTAAPIVPGARGDVDISKDQNGNTKMKMKIQHLANAESLTPPAAGYVIWLQERDGNPENEGQLKVNKNLEATYETVTSLKNFSVFVTAEQDLKAKSPSGSEVLKATIQP
jgi:hypothetical protein